MRSPSFVVSAPNNNLSTEGISLQNDSQPKLHLSLLGKFKLLRGDEPVVTVDTPRLQSLLSCLVLNSGIPQSRAGLAYELWPDSAESQALTNLRNQLHALKKALPEAATAIKADKKTLCWNDHSLTTDVALFVEAIESAKQAKGPAQSFAQLSDALTLYEGPLLPSCYDDWIVVQRERLENLFRDTTKRVVSTLAGEGDYESAIALVKRLVRETPENENLHRQLMLLYEKNGDRASALAAYRECVSILQSELNIGPSQETRNLHSRLLADYQESSHSEQDKTSIEKPELPLQGRKKELGLLKKQWNRSMEGHPSLTLLVGEAGIGKSRLAEEISYWVSQQGFSVAKARSYATEGNLAYSPLMHWLRSESLLQTVKKLDTPLVSEFAKLLPELKREFPNIVSESQNEGNQPDFFDAISIAFQKYELPLLLVLDDLQWTDVGTLSWLQYFLRSTTENRIMILGTIREEELPDSPELQHLITTLAAEDLATEIRLDRLDQETSSSIAADVMGRPLPETQTQSLFSETEGNPLFIVESMRAAKSPGNSKKENTENAEGPLSNLPEKVRSVFVARLDQLSENARELIGVAAVLGRSFSFEMMCLIVNHEEEEIVDALEELWERRLIREQENGTYDFSHDKMREVAYAELSPPRRRFLHRKAAQALNIRYLYNLDVIQPRVATHYEKAGDPDKAIRAYTNAGNHAKTLNANSEAIRLFQKGLNLARKLPSNRVSLETELDLLQLLGKSLSQSSDAERESTAAFKRAKEICTALGKPFDESSFAK